MYFVLQICNIQVSERELLCKSIIYTKLRVLRPEVLVNFNNAISTCSYCNFYIVHRTLTMCIIWHKNMFSTPHG